MKKPLILACLIALLAGSASFAQLRKIPAEVTNSFTEKYPKASNVEWNDKLTGFVAEFMLDDESYMATFNNKGEWENTEKQIDENEIPSVVKDSYDKSKYAEWEIGAFHKIELADGSIHYRIQAIKSDIQKKNLYFSDKGRLLRDKITL